MGYARFRENGHECRLAGGFRILCGRRAPCGGGGGGGGRVCAAGRPAAGRRHHGAGRGGRAALESGGGVRMELRSGRVEGVWGWGVEREIISSHFLLIPFSHSIYLPSLPFSPPLPFLLPSPLSSLLPFLLPSLPFSPPLPFLLPPSPLSSTRWYREPKRLLRCHLVLW